MSDSLERIASFQVDHTKLLPGLYLSRVDGDIVTFDLRFKKPNTGDLLSNSELHSAEHLIATLLRNSPEKDAVIFSSTDASSPMKLPSSFCSGFSAPRETLRAKCPAKAPWNAETTSTSTWRPDAKPAHGMRS